MRQVEIDSILHSTEVHLRNFYGSIVQKTSVEEDDVFKIGKSVFVSVPWYKYRNGIDFSNSMIEKCLMTFCDAAASFDEEYNNRVLNGNFDISHMRIGDELTGDKVWIGIQEKLSGDLLCELMLPTNQSLADVYVTNKIVTKTVLFLKNINTAIVLEKGAITAYFHSCRWYPQGRCFLMCYHVLIKGAIYSHRGWMKDIDDFSGRVLSF